MVFCLIVDSDISWTLFSYLFVLARGGLTRPQYSHTFLTIFLHIIQKLDEVRGLSVSDGRVILVRVVFVSKLSAVDLYFSLRRSKPRPKNCN